ncbi:MAG: WD40 repeat domain-containing protein, partial [Gemmataceae bacterium]
DHVIHIWDTVSGRRLLDYPQAHRTALGSVAYSPDGRQAATGGQEGVGRLWDVATAKQVGRLRFSERPISGIEVVAFSSDGRTVAAGGDEFTPQRSIGWIKLWDRKSGAELWTQRPESRVSALTFSLDGQSVAVATGAVDGEGERENAIRIYERDTGKERAQRTDLTRRVRALVFSPDGKLLRSYGEDRILRVWEWSSKKPPTRHRLNNERSSHRSVTFSPDGKLLATSVGFTDTIVLRDANTGTEISKIRVEKSMGSVLAFSPDGRVLATSSMRVVNSDKPFDYDLHLWDLLTEREIRTLRPGRASVSALAFSPDGREVLAGMDNGTGLIWSITSSEENGRKPKGQMGEEELKRLWADLGGDDTARAYEAIGSLATNPNVTVPFLRRHLHPAKPADPNRVRQLIADLENSEFARREAANHALEALGGKVRPALRKALEGKPTLEQRKRLEALLAAPHTIRQPELLRQVRGVQVLEMIGSEEARQVLRSVVNGAAQARLTEEARASLHRLATRPPIKP